MKGSRRIIEILLGLLILMAGCISSPAGTQTGTPSPTPGEASQTDTLVPTTTTTLTPQPLPERPNQLTSESVRTFVKHLETACKWNGLLQTQTTAMEVMVERVEVNETRMGYLATLRVSYFSETPSGHGDGEYEVAYFVNESVILRTDEVLPSEPLPDPRRDGTPVAPSTEQSC